MVAAIVIKDTTPFFLLVKWYAFLNTALLLITPQLNFKQYVTEAIKFCMEPSFVNHMSITIGVARHLIRSRLIITQEIEWWIRKLAPISAILYTIKFPYIWNMYCSQGSHLEHVIISTEWTLLASILTSALLSIVIIAYLRNLVHVIDILGFWFVLCSEYPTIYRANSLGSDHRCKGNICGEV